MKKMMLLALAAASVAMFALPAVASAGTPEVHCNGGVVCGAFNSHGGASTLSSGNLTVTCTTNTGTGNLGTKGGTVALTFHGCKDSAFGSNCNSPGQPAGTISTGTLNFKNVYVTHGKTDPGVTVGPVNTTFTCFFGASHHLVTGNVLGTVTPKCGGPVASLTLAFEAVAHGNQKHDFVTGTGTAHTLLDNGAPAAMQAVGTVSFPGDLYTVTCV